MTGQLVVCGLGCEPEVDATLEALAALTACARRFARLSPRRRHWLAARVGPVRPAPDARALVAAARTRLVGLAVWGHPTVTSAYARRVLAEAVRAGVPVTVLASLSPAGKAIASTARPLGWRPDEDDGWSVLPAPDRPRALRDRPVVVFDGEAETLLTLVPRRRRARR